MRSVLEVWPTTSYGMASPTERSDQTESLARVLMGLSHPVQLISTARETSGQYDWPKPPTIERRWLAVLSADDEVTLQWRTRTLQSSLEGVGLKCGAQTAGGGLAASTLLAPIVTSRGSTHSQNEWTASLVLRRWPREVAPGWLGNALSGDLPVDVAIHVKPEDPGRIARRLKKQKEWQDAANIEKPDAGNTLGSQDAERVRMKLIARTDRPCKVAIVLTVRAKDRDQLKQRVETLTHELGLALADARPATWEHDLGLEATLPLGRCRVLGVWRTLDCTSVASTWPFQPATINHQNGADLGTTHDGSMLVRLDPFDPSLESFGIVILAKVGMGKSYLIKLLCRRLVGVEVLIVEQRTPAEYGAVAGAQSFNLADIPYAERAAHLREFVSVLWSEAKRDPRPRLLVLDELWSLLRDPALAALVEEIARIGRHHYLSLAIATQQVSELIENGKAVLDNAAIRIYLKQHDRDLERLCDAVGLPVPARRFLRGAARGQALLDVGGMLVPVDIQASPGEHREITTDPREKHNGTIATGVVALRNGSGHADAIPVGSGHLETGVRGVAAVHPDAAAGE